MKDRMNFIRRSEGLSLAQLANILGTNPSTLAHITSGRNKPGYDILSAIATKLPHYNLRWLLTGEGEPLLAENSAAEGDFAPDTTQEATPQVQGELIMPELFATDMEVSGDTATKESNDPSTTPTPNEFADSSASSNTANLEPATAPEITTATAMQGSPGVTTASEHARQQTPSAVATAAPTERLIICFADHTFTEYTRRQE